jgi:glycosyltransferase involved in cell wall biosynthesis
MIKIIWLLHDAFPSGATKCVFEYIDIIDKEKYEFILIIPRKGLIIEEIEKRKIKYYIVPFYHSTRDLRKKIPFINPKRYFRNLYAIHSLIKILKKEKPHKTITNTITSNILGFASSILKINHIQYVHEFGKEDHGFTFNFGEKIGYKLINFLTYKIITNSEASKNKLEKFIKSEKISIIRYPINIPMFSNAEKFETKSFIFLGQISKSKCQLDVLKAINNFKNVPIFKLNIIGSIVDKEYFEELQEYISKNNLSKIVTIYNFMHHPYEFLQKHHFLIMASKMEAFGRVTVEAMLLGVPVIGRNTGGTKELIEEEANGFKFETIEELSNIIEKSIFLSEDKYIKLVENSKKFANLIVDENLIKKQIESILNT